MNIVITGGGSGLGEAILKQLAGIPSNKLLFTFFKSTDKAHRLEKEFPNAKAIYCDFSSAESLDNLLEQISVFNPDILINNAISGMVKQHFHKISAITFQTHFDVNVLPLIRITQQAITIFRKKKFGKIITVLSAAGVSKPAAGWSEYIASKAYVEALSRSWATENIAFNITANCVSPSFMKTQLTSDTDERIIEEMIRAHPLKSLLTVEEVALTIGFLTNASNHINGINLVMNAGTEL